jgi:hypothetical protein
MGLPMTEYRQCLYCGRKGTRQFVPAGHGGHLCKAKRSCLARRRRFLAPLVRGAR